MKYPVILLSIATLVFFVGVGIRMHADGKYMDKMYYHTIDAGLHQFADVFAERKIGDTLQRWSILAAAGGGVWFVVVAMKRGGTK